MLSFPQLSIPRIAIAYRCMLKSQIANSHVPQVSQDNTPKIMNQSAHRYLLKLQIPSRNALLPAKQHELQVPKLFRNKEIAVSSSGLRF